MIQLWINTNCIFQDQLQVYLFFWWSSTINFNLLDRKYEPNNYYEPTLGLNCQITQEPIFPDLKTIIVGSYTPVFTV